MRGSGSDSAFSVPPELRILKLLDHTVVFKADIKDIVKEDTITNNEHLKKN